MTTRRLQPTFEQKNSKSAKAQFTMNKPIALACLVAGIILLAFGISSADSFGSDVSRFFTGSPTDKSVWMMIGGAVLAVVGLFGAFRGAK